LWVRTLPVIMAIASQIYFALTKKLPQSKGLIGCSGFIRGCCPENDVTEVITGKQIKTYTVCIFKYVESKIYIPTIKEMRNNAQVIKFDEEKGNFSITCGKITSLLLGYFQNLYDFENDKIYAYFALFGGVFYKMSSYEIYLLQLIEKLQKKQ